MLELKNITKKFNEKTVLDNISLNIENGEIVSLLGQSGSGKTTLLKRLIPELCALGLRPGLIKHTHHDMDVDKDRKSVV